MPLLCSQCLTKELVHYSTSMLEIRFFIESICKGNRTWHCNQFSLISGVMKFVPYCDALGVMK